MATILIVDDEEPVRSLLAEVLAEDGYQTRLASHGEQAWELVTQERPDLVLSDIMMPLLNGKELCQRLKAGEDTKAVPVILMSSAGDRAADGAGADAFIDKPFDLSAMEALVRHWLPEREQH